MESFGGDGKKKFEEEFKAPSNISIKPAINQITIFNKSNSRSNLQY
jgi:hypothetical protein